MAREIHNGRFTAEIDGDFVLFLIGMRFNRPWAITKWTPVGRSMGPMLTELASQPSLGLLHTESWFGRTTILLQYWRSFEHLERFARDPELTHFPAWRRFNRKVAASGDVGIWHETYEITAGSYEAIYGNMPRFGLAAAGRHVRLGKGSQSAAARIGQTDDDQPAIEPYPNPD